MRAPTGALVLIPVFNDWPALGLLLDHLDRELAMARRTAQVLVIDDGSTLPCTLEPRSRQGALLRVDVVRLRRNLGHQRSIAIGLSYAHETIRPSAVVVMDGDGEDSPSDVPRLLAELESTQGDAIVFAERRRRSEGLVFSAFYAIYRFAHWCLTGIPVRVGNFSALPGAHLERLVVVSELWNHYAAAVFKARIPRTTIPTTRAMRLQGRSRMSFVGLVGHGLSALSVHAEVVGVRLLVTVFGASAVVVLLLLTVVAIRLFTDLAIPGWATASAGLLLVLLSQAVTFAVMFAFLVLHGRSQPSFIPIRDYRYFVSESSTLSFELTTAADV
jgi:polyisoprenyl-phosphate glycosyltransferase